MMAKVSQLGGVTSVQLFIHYSLTIYLYVPHFVFIFVSYFLFLSQNPVHLLIPPTFTSSLPLKIKYLKFLNLH